MSRVNRLTASMRARRSKRARTLPMSRVNRLTAAMRAQQRTRTLPMSRVDRLTAAMRAQQHAQACPNTADEPGEPTNSSDAGKAMAVARTLPMSRVNRLTAAMRAERRSDVGRLWIGSHHCSYGTRSPGRSLTHAKVIDYMRDCDE